MKASVKFSTRQEDHQAKHLAVQGDKPAKKAAAKSATTKTAAPAKKAAAPKAAKKKD